jgi:sugar lactone lactonase YvrE
LVTTLSGSAGQTGSADGPVNAARFNGPTGVAVDSASNLYVVDSGNNAIRKIYSDGLVATLAGNPAITNQGAMGMTLGGSSDGTGSVARFNGPIGVTVDGAGNLYVGDASNVTVRKITPTGTNWG